MNIQMSEHLTYQNIILGLGATGVSVAKFLQNQDEDFMVMDTRDNPPGQKELYAISPDIKLSTGEFDQEILNRAKRLIVNPGLSVKQQSIVNAKRHGVEIIGDIELFARQIKNSNVKLIGVTGSNGKSTVTSLVRQMASDAGLNALMGGNIGTPALDLLIEDKTDVYVLELSSFQLDTTNSLQCDVACVLNISPDHLDRYVDFEEYVKSKQKLINQTKTIVLFEDDEILNKLKVSVKRIGFRADVPSAIAEFGLKTLSNDLWLVRGEEPLLSVSDIRLKGRHNVLNSLAALAIGFEIGLTLSTMLETLTKFEGLKHRTQFVREISGVSWINDSKGTNVDATIAAIQGLAQKQASNLVLLAGGQGKQGDFYKLAKSIEGRVKLNILFGEDAKEMRDYLSQAANTCVVDSLEQAVRLAKETAARGDIVLLSPACASFDMFDNYAARGDRFIELVENLS